MMDVIMIGLVRWRAIISPNGGAHSELRYSPHDGRLLFASGPTGTAWLEKGIDADVSFYSQKSLQSKAQNCDGFAKHWINEGKPHGLEVNVDLPAKLWEDLWIKSMTTTAYGVLMVSIAVGIERIPPNEYMPIADPSITFYSTHPKI